MYTPEYVIENETHKILWNFEAQTDHLIPPRKQDLMIINKKKENLPFSVKIREKEKERNTSTLPEN